LITNYLLSFTLFIAGTLFTIGSLSSVHQVQLDIPTQNLRAHRGFVTEDQDIKLATDTMNFELDSKGLRVLGVKKNSETEQKLNTAVIFGETFQIPQKVKAEKLP